MANELIINVTLGETRVARLENGVVAELYIEHAKDQGVVGNVYKGKVVRVLPGMQAAFVEIGLDRTAFLHASDVIADVAQYEQKLIDEDFESGEESESKPKRSSKNRQDKRIQDLLKEGREILVQVEKGPISTKGARLTTHVSLPGRNLVYMPTSHHVGVSRRIDDDKERKRLRDLVLEERPKGAGFIIRTAGSQTTRSDIQTDMQYLLRTWKEVETKVSENKAPSLIHEELDVLMRVVRDLFTSDIDRLIIDDPAAAKRIRDFVATFMPSLESQVEVYDGNEPIFDHFGIEVEITRALGQKVWLKSGGYIIIEQTEALTAIDVNTGRFVGRRNLEDTILKTNLEAVKEIVYQLRLRNIGGIIILDFIDMERRSNRQKVFTVLKEALKQDRARTSITKISDLGLVEMTRKRTKEDIRRQLTDPCLYCEGKGYLKSATTIAYEIFRETQRVLSEEKANQYTIFCHPHVANLLYDEERKWLEKFEHLYKVRLAIKGVADYHVEQFDVEKDQ